SIPSGISAGRSGFDALLECDTCLSDDLADARELVPDVDGELLGGAADAKHRLGVEARGDFGRLDGTRGFAAQPVDDGARRSSPRHDSVPRSCLIGGNYGFLN